MTPPRIFMLVALTVLLGVLPVHHRPLSVAAWEQADYEIFDLVDEVEKAAGEEENFYTLLGVKPDASLKEITKGYRKQSLLWHPDKNDSPEASRRQKLIGVVASVLREDENRKRYDFFLRNGVPRWRGTGYYYRRHRPGLGSVLIGLVVFISMLQYLGAWVLCLRRRSVFREILAETAEMTLRRTPRRSMKKSVSRDIVPDDSASESNTSGRSTPLLHSAENLLSGVSPDPMNDPVVQFPAPSPKDVLIIQLPWAVFRGVVALPVTLANFIRGPSQPGLKRCRSKERNHGSVSESEDEEDSETARKRKAKIARNHAAGGESTNTSSRKQVAAVRRMANRRPVKPKFVQRTGSESDVAGKSTSSKAWTDEDVALLKDLATKFPPGSSGRWTLISRALGREERAVVAKYKELK